MPRSVTVLSLKMRRIVPTNAADSDETKTRETRDRHTQPRVLEQKERSQQERKLEWNLRLLCYNLTNCPCSMRRSCQKAHCPTVQTLSTRVFLLLQVKKHCDGSIGDTCGNLCTEPNAVSFEWFSVLWQTEGTLTWHIHSERVLLRTIHTSSYEKMSNAYSAGLIRMLAWDLLKKSKSSVHTV